MEKTDVLWQEDVCEEGDSWADLNGIDLQVSPKKGQWWDWWVLPTGSRSEYPEVWSLGRSRTRDGARKAAIKSAVKADRAYPTINYG